MCLLRNKKGKSKALSGGLCLRDLEAKQKALQFLHMKRSNVCSYSSASKLRKQDPSDRTLELPFVFCNKHTASFKNHPSPAPSENLPYWFQGNFAAMFVLNYRLRGFLLSTFANRVELR